MVKLKKIQAFTILESMVAMVIVMIAFGLTSVTLINIASSGITKEKQQAAALAKLIRNETLQESRYLDETITFEDMTIEKMIVAHPLSGELKILQIEAYKDKEKLFESKEIILLKDIITNEN